MTALLSTGAASLLRHADRGAPGPIVVPGSVARGGVVARHEEAGHD